MTDTLHKRVTLVTGASKGIGRATALRLASLGHVVIAVARSKDALLTLDDEIRAGGNEAVLVPMDLSDFKGYATLARVISEQFGRLDGLFSNAGVLGPIGPLPNATPRAVEEVINVNLTSNWYLIRSFETLLLRSQAPRALFMSSGVVPRPRAFWGPYQASKAGLESLVTAWVEETRHTALKVNLFDPGAVATDMRAEAVPGEDPATLPSPADVASIIAPMLGAGESRHGVRVDYRVEAIK